MELETPTRKLRRDIRKPTPTFSEIKVLIPRRAERGSDIHVHGGTKRKAVALKKEAAGFCLSPPAKPGLARDPRRCLQGRDPRDTQAFVISSAVVTANS